MPRSLPTRRGGCRDGSPGAATLVGSPRGGARRACDISTAATLSPQQLCSARKANGDPDPIDLRSPDPGGSRVVALAAGKSAEKIPTGYRVVAATETGGVWTRTNSNATWTRITTGASKILTAEGQNQSANIIWSTDAPYMYIFDPHTGTLWQSPNLLASSGSQWSAGQWTFKMTWQADAEYNDVVGSNYVVGDLSQLEQPARPASLWASTNLGRFRLGLKTAGDSTDGSVTTIVPLKEGGMQPVLTGPLAVDRASGATADALIVSRGLQTAVETPNLWTLSASAGASLSVASGPGFLNQSLTLDSMAIGYSAGAGATRHVYIANHEGSGVIVNPAPAQ